MCRLLSSYAYLVVFVFAPAVESAERYSTEDAPMPQLIYNFVSADVTRARPCGLRYRFAPQSYRDLPSLRGRIGHLQQDSSPVESAKYHLMAIGSTPAAVIDS